MQQYFNFRKSSIVLFWHTNYQVVLFEFSLPFEANIEKAYDTEKEQFFLVADSTDMGLRLLVCRSCC